MVSGTDFLRSLPPNPSPARERAIFDAVRAGYIAPIQWWGVRSTAHGRSILFYVSADAIRVGTAADSLRINVNARTAQQIADVLGCILPTTRMCDLVWEQAVVRLTPCMGRPDNAMGSTARMVSHHMCVEGKLAGRAGLVETVGKNWVITNLLAKRPGRAANYGWFDPAAPYGSKPGARGPHRVWQPLGLAHDTQHVDYSQILRLVHRYCVVDDGRQGPRSLDLVQVLRHPELAPLVSDEGTMQLWRVPGVSIGAPAAAALNAGA